MIQKKYGLWPRKAVLYYVLHRSRVSIVLGDGAKEERGFHS